MPRSAGRADVNIEPLLLLLICLLWLSGLVAALASGRRYWARTGMQGGPKRVALVAGAVALLALTAWFRPWQPAIVTGSGAASIPSAAVLVLWGLCLLLTAASVPNNSSPPPGGSGRPFHDPRRRRRLVVPADGLRTAKLSRLSFLLSLAAVAGWVVAERPGGSGLTHGSAGIPAAADGPVPRRVRHVVVFIQENHTTDNYFGGLAAYGANVAVGWPVQANPPVLDQPHDRKAYARWLQEGTATRSQFDTFAVIPYYAYLALTGAFVENHCSGFGTNSTPNHLLLLGGQSPTLHNPPGTPGPDWDMPSVPGLADESGVSWRCYTAGRHYPARYYTQLKDSPNLVETSRFITDASTGSLPALSYVWHDSADNEHPTRNVREGMDSIWQAVDAVVTAGDWDDTVFLLTWDDWGGWDDHVQTPNIEHTADGVQLAYGPRVPLILFGGPVRPGVDSRWSSHPGVAKTVMQLLGLPALGVPRVDTDPGLGDLIDPNLHQKPPPPFGSVISLPAAPVPAPKPTPTPPAPTPKSVPVPAVFLRDGSTLPPPNDVKLKANVPGAAATPHRPNLPEG